MAEILRASGVQVVEFRASIVIGSGSLSFEMISSLVERLPVMVTPKWVGVTAQPIAVADLLQYLCAALHLESDTHEIFEIGGPDPVSYGDLMREYGRQRRLRRLIIRVPVPPLGMQAMEERCASASGARWTARVGPRPPQTLISSVRPGLEQSKFYLTTR